MKDNNDFTESWVEVVPMSLFNRLLFETILDQDINTIWFFARLFHDLVGETVIVDSRLYVRLSDCRVIIDRFNCPDATFENFVLVLEECKESLYCKTPRPINPKDYYDKCYPLG